MPYPHHSELELPLLKLLFEQGGGQHEIRAIDTYGPLADYFHLTEHERSRSRDSVLADGRMEPYWNNMVQFARRKLKERGFLAPASHGFWRLSEIGVEKAQPVPAGHLPDVVYPDEVSGTLLEGTARKVTVNAYERSVAGRQACIDHYGYRCCVCDFDFEERYGGRGKHFVHVHHLVPLASIGEAYVLDPIKDLRPICPNCHSMIHRTDPPCSIEILKGFIK
jgi:5-methylcytosine-specific restriction protein A